MAGPVEVVRRLGKALTGPPPCSRHAGPQPADQRPARAEELRHRLVGAAGVLDPPAHDDGDRLHDDVRRGEDGTVCLGGRGAPIEALVPIPETLTDTEAAPRAGITTYNALRHSGAFPGDLVAVQGIGGLGHLGIQFANKFGYNVVAIGRGSETAVLAKKLGASVYIDSGSTNPAEALQKLGGAQVILATAPSSKAMSELIDGLGPNGKLMVIGATFDPIEVTPIQLISGSRTIQGWAAGTSADSEDTLHFAELKGVRPMIETYPLERAGEAYARMMSGKAQFRVVLTM